MKITSADITAEIERLAEAFPWDTVSMWIDRRPEGRWHFTAHLHSNEKFGFSTEFESGATPQEAVDAMIKDQQNKRDPEIAREKKIRELKEQIEKLQQVVIGLPPYVPNRELTNGEPAIKLNDTINV